MEPFQTKKGGVISGIFLFAGYIIGVGTLALPIALGVGGFFPSALMTVLIWLFLLSLGFLFLETILASPDGENVVSLARRYTGFFGVFLGATAFLFSHYSVMTTYYAVIASMLEQHAIPRLLTYSLMPLLFGGIVYCGVYATSRVVFVVTLALIGTFVLLFLGVSEKISFDNLTYRDWIFILLSLPILFQALSIQSILPTLSTFLKRNITSLTVVLIVGSLIPLILFLGWEFAILGSFSLEVLLPRYEHGDLIEQMFDLIKQTPWLATVALFFSLLAILSSFFGIALSTVDFLGDAIKIPVQKRTGLSRFYLCLAVFLPPLFFLFVGIDILSWIYTYCGGFFVLILGCLLPIWMGWNCRYHSDNPPPTLLPGGRPVILILLCITLFLAYLQGILVTR